MNDLSDIDIERRLRELEAENESLRIRLTEAEETLEAIQSGAVDAVVIDTEEGKQIFTLQGADFSYRELVETMNEGAVTITPDHTALYCNGRIAGMLKTTGDEITGKQIDQYIHPDDLESFKSVISKSLAEKSSAELRLVCADGQTIPVLLSCNPFSKDSTGIWLIFTELTDLKRTQHQLELLNDSLEYIVKERTDELKQRNEELKKSEEKFRLLTENASDLIWTLNLTKGKYTYIGPSVQRLSGYTAEEAIHHSFEESLTPESVQKVYELIPIRIKEFTENPQSNKVYLDQFGQKCKDGSVKWIEATTKLQYNTAGEIEVIGVSRDITERKRAEDKLKESEERFAEAFNNNTAALSIAQIEDGVILDVNESYSNLFGYSREEMVGRSSLDLNLFVNPSDRGEIIRRLKEKGQVRNMEIEGRTKDGRIFTVLASAGKIHIRNAEYVLWTAIDVTERKKAEEDIRRHSLLVESINRVLESAMHCETEEDLGVACLEIAGELTQSKFGFIDEINEHGLRDIAISNPGGDACTLMDDNGHRKPSGNFKIHGIFGRVITDGKPVLTNDPPTHPDSIGLPAGHPPLESFLGVPMMRDGHTTGIIAVANRPGGYTLAEQETLEALAPVVMEAFMRKRAEAALRESEERFRIALKNAPVGVAIQDKNLVYQWSYNQKSRRPEEIQGKTDEELFSAEDAEWMIPFKKEILETGQVIDVEKWVNSNGHKFYLSIHYEPLKDSTGAIIGIGMATVDLTGRKLAEEALAETKAKLDLTLENGNVGIWERDLKTNRMIWDKQTEKMMGFREGSFDGTFESFEKCLVEEDVPHVLENIRKALEENVPYETVFRVKLPNGNINYINSKGSVTYDEEGRGVKFSGVCFDITDMKKGAEEALFKLNDELLRSNKELEQFAYVASHDLQEPLRMVASFTQLLGQRYKDKLDEDGQQFVSFAMGGAQRCQMLLNDLLKFSRVNTRGQAFADVDMNKALEVTLHNLSLSIRDKNAAVTSDVLPAIKGDEGQLVQLLQNLIGNSLKFCHRQPKVHISAEEKPDHYLFSVKDNGIGIEQQYSDKIFRIFQRLFPKEEYDGTGIGLAICKRIVERHGGQIYFESELGEGTTFYFTINKEFADPFASINRPKSNGFLNEKAVHPGSQLSKHEYEVYKIELDMQNDELQAAKSVAQDALEKYMELYDFAPMAYFTFSREGKIIELNFGGAAILGKERSQLINSMFGFFVSNDTRPVFNRFLERVFNNKVKETCEITISAEGNSSKNVYLVGTVNKDEEQCFATAIDISL